MKAIFTVFSAMVSLASLAQTAPPVQWQQRLGASDPLADYAYSVQQTSDSGYIVAGIFNRFPTGFPTGDYGIAKLTKNGGIAWQKTLGGSGGETAYSIQQTSDGGYIVAGESFSNDDDVSGNHGGYDYWI